MDENLTRGYCQLRSPKLKKRPVASRDGLTPPQDPCSCIYLGLVLAGAGFLLPYNSFITAVDYYQSRFPRTTIIFDMSLTYIIVAFISVCINNALVETLSLPVRITFGYLLSFVMLLIIALCDVWFQVFTQDMAYTVTLGAVAIVAIGSTGRNDEIIVWYTHTFNKYTPNVGMKCNITMSKSRFISNQTVTLQVLSTTSLE